jgi:molybdopterin adenylyltransferase
LRELVDEEGCDLVLTTGGTGPAPRDVTPEATLASRQGDARLRRADAAHQPGFVPTAILSRQVGGDPRPALVINLPGSRRRSPRRWKACRIADAGRCRASSPRCLTAST